MSNLVEKGHHVRSHHMDLVTHLNPSAQSPLSSNNCVMPTARFRCEAFNRSGVYAGLRTYADIELHNVTISAVCRVAGSCKIEMYLGNFVERMEVETLIQDVASEVRGDVETVT